MNRQIDPVNAVRIVKHVKIFQVGATGKQRRTLAELLGEGKKYAQPVPTFNA